MSFKEIHDVPKNHQLTITLPQNFPSQKKVVVTVDELPLSKKEKMKLMKKAVADPNFLKDMSDVNNDFDLISEHERTEIPAPGELQENSLHGHVSATNKVSRVVAGAPSIDSLH